MIYIFRAFHRSCRAHFSVIWAVISAKGKKKQRFLVSSCDKENCKNAGYGILEGNYLQPSTLEFYYSWWK